MTLRLTVQRAAWEAHVHAVAAGIDGLVPVVKGNGYGFGRATLHPLIKGLSDYVCVGSVHELDDVADRVTPVVLTPSLTPPPPLTGSAAVMTIGSLHDVTALAGWRGRVVVKLQSSMQRYGVTTAELDTVSAAAHGNGLDVIGYALHLPLAGSDYDRTTEVDAWLEHLDPRQPLWLS
ncbi:MAG: alanine racemase, partial [Actinomycetota bacterium]|nr:alanine racemase [Actinomycetota bacterium]